MEYEKLTLSNDFIFAKVMQNEELCKRLLEIILDIRINRIVYHEEQKVIDDAPDGKAVRLDVYVQDDENTVFDIEMQASDTKELPKRSRYYQGRIDVAILDKGTKTTYKDLNRSYIIFICMQDIFGKGRHYYRFENVCTEDTDIKLNDGAIKIFLNPDSDMDDIDEELSNFLKYLKTGVPSDSFTVKLNESVQFARLNKGWKEEYRMIDMQRRVWEQEAEEKGMAKGLEKGMAKGLEKGMAKGLEKGLEKGMEAGIKEGKLKVVLTYIKKGMTTVEEASKDLDIPVSEIEEALKDAERKAPLMAR
ncbi:MAG: Rpn family recombination-promoting nuclease/putative transposase [Lachnospiraceae bacterium]|nr:Rpn family recombination-promoting nuclease/putative transposase [Lachnospiraceae bacterium]